MLEVQQRVANGVAFLDVKEPEWRHMMNTDSLDLANGMNCVLGQITGIYGTGLDKYDLTMTEAENYGFMGDRSNGGVSSQYYSDCHALTAEWRHVLDEPSADVTVQAVIDHLTSMVEQQPTLANLLIFTTEQDGHDADSLVFIAFSNIYNHLNSQESN